LEGEAGDAVGRDYYEHGAQAGQGYRNGYRTGRLKTAEGAIEYCAPQVAGREEPYRSAIREHLKGHTQALEELAIEMLARGLSVRDIEDAFKDESGRLLLSKTAVSELGERLWEDYQTFARRDLSEYEIVYLFVDGLPNACGLGASASRCWPPGAYKGSGHAGVIGFSSCSSRGPGPRRPSRLSPDQYG
jgi:putative transposase